jgi:hypothetical protein
VLAAGASLLRNVDIRSNLRFIFRWKLQSFKNRFPWVRAWPDGIPEEKLSEAVTAAQKATMSNEESIRDALQKLDNLPYVGVPVASAFLTAMHPEKFTVIDRQAYKALGADFRQDVSEYLRYLKFCQQQAARFKVSLRDHDRALWQFGAEIPRRKTARLAGLGS